ncbi:LOW QUALITY PROTEIN: uncharacterized protein LOC109800321 [Cajanus cajan]|uniref:LOW QUALITY PROTEIN: uncharacterized protein LOC109800321 n=1 Tax=Cajanus cajan TaxID=3821 RepID=UPI0010FB8122|nr:LOW QUALITY PROTEIN: uncharacterized protein LOC109800321 [Cajanus cajan]
MKLHEHRGSSSFPEAYFQIAFAVIVYYINWILDYCKLYRCCLSFQRATHLDPLLEESRSLSTKKVHDSGMRTICICETKTIDIINKTRTWLEEILWEKKCDMDVYRCKGVLSVQNSDQLHTLQAVREVYEIVPARMCEKEEKRINKIVFLVII